MEKKVLITGMSGLIGGAGSKTGVIGIIGIGNNVSFGAGAVTGNLRLDEKNVIGDEIKIKKLDILFKKTT